MDVLKHIENVYLVGIGGIGMSALARYFHCMGYRVAGYDRTESDLTRKMDREEGISVQYEDRPDRLEAGFRKKENTLVIYTPAVPADNSLLKYFREAGFRLHKRSEVLGLLSRSGKALCVAGTHGKTTTTTLLAYLLKNSSVGCNAFLGGISMDFGTNYLVDPASEYIVVEADEFDRSFLQLTPYLAAITAMDADHLDIYGTKEKLDEAFEAFASKVVPEGKLFLKEGLHLAGVSVEGYYGLEKRTDFYSDRLRIEKGHYVFDYHGKSGCIESLELGIPGKMNVENATLAITLALEAGVTPLEIRKALPGFRGVMRRFNIHTNGRVIYIDDYAHHPREIEAVLKSVREMWPRETLIVAFQPHLYSRTQDLYEWFARSLSLADNVVLLDIYPARELPIPGVTSELILKNLTVPSCWVKREEFPEWVAEKVKEGVFLTLGAGDIDRFVPVFTAMFCEKNKREKESGREKNA